MSYLSTVVQHPHYRKLGVLACAFFLVKGLLWLAAPFLFLVFI